MTRLTVCLTFDFDAMSLWLAQGSRNPAQLSRGEYAAYVMPRILRMLARHGVNATFFIPGHTALAYPDIVRRIVAEGHEVGHHGWVHESLVGLDPAKERDVFARGLEALHRTAGANPVGFRSPGCDFSPATVDILLENGFLYDSSFSAQDFQPHYLRQGDRWSVDEPYEFGRHVAIAEIPFSWTLDDFPHFEFDPGWSTEQSPASAVREIWQAEFDYAHQNEGGGVFTLCMHPEVIGRAHRLMMLDDLVSHMRSADGVTFARAGDYALNWRAQVSVADYVASLSSSSQSSSS